MLLGRHRLHGLLALVLVHARLERLRLSLRVHVLLVLLRVLRVLPGPAAPAIIVVVVVWMMARHRSFAGGMTIQRHARVDRLDSNRSSPRPPRLCGVVGVDASMLYQCLIGQ